MYINCYFTVHICTRRSSAQLQQVIVKQNHSHLFLLLDIIMRILTADLCCEDVSRNRSDKSANISGTCASVPIKSGSCGQTECAEQGGPPPPDPSACPPGARSQKLQGAENRSLWSPDRKAFIQGGIGTSLLLRKAAKNCSRQFFWS